MDNTLERFKALDPRDQERILDKHRDINTDDDYWYESIYEDFIVDVNEFGYAVETQSGRGRGHCIWFSGFSSQGDGACFDGYVWDWQVATKNWPVLAEYMKAQDVDKYLRWASKGNYTHEGTLTFIEDIDRGNPYVERTERMRWLAQEDLLNDITKYWDEFVKHTEEHVKQLCRKLYRALEEEYYYLTSDEAVLETLHANDMLEDELKEYEDGEGEEPESIGPTDQCTDRAAA